MKQINLLISSTFLIVFLLTSGCDKKCDMPMPPVSVQFLSTTSSVTEGDSTNVVLSLASTIDSEQIIKIQLNGDATYGADKDYILNSIPDASNQISISWPANTLTYTIKLKANKDHTRENPEIASFFISELPLSMVLGANQLTSVTISDPPVPSGLVAEYLFEGNSLDTSGKGHDGNVNGATLTTGKSGEANSAYYFGGSQYIQIPNNSDMNFTAAADFTVSVWVNPSNTQNDMAGTINNVIRQWQGDAQGYPFTIAYYNSSHPINPKGFYGGRYSGSACGPFPGAISAAVTSAFHFVVLRKSGTKLDLFVDNVLASEIDDDPSCATTNTTDVFIGCQGGVSRCITGTIDDLRVFNRALTSEEMTLLSNL